jgi:hypothetical protein
VQHCPGRKPKEWQLHPEPGLPDGIATAENAGRFIAVACADIPVWHDFDLSLPLL